MTNCLLHEPQQTVYPSGDQSKLRFKDHDKELPHQFYLVCDFEAFLSPVDCGDDGRSPEDEGKKTCILDTHQISGFCSHRVTDSERHQTPPTVYSGSDVISHFYEHVMSESRQISEILSVQVPLAKMSPDEEKRHRAATVCENCRCEFTHDNYRVRHHCHVSGKYLFPACNSCNLALKPKRCKTNMGNEYILPVIFHNKCKTLKQFKTPCKDDMVNSDN